MKFTVQKSTSKKSSTNAIAQKMQRAVHFAAVAILVVNALKENPCHLRHPCSKAFALMLSRLLDFSFQFV
jgi:hypothetical protein